MYVTSRGFTLPSDAKTMGSLVWFNLWRNRLWPFAELQEGDELLWYETPSRRIVWRTQVTDVRRFAYDGLDEALDRIDKELDVAVDRGQDYVVGRPERGYALAYRVRVLERLDLPKPPGLVLNRLGWERADRPEIAAWLGRTPATRSDSAEAPEASNPDWARDEVILALQLYVDGGCLGGGPLLSKTDPRIVALSELLRRLPIHPRAGRRPDFRNPAGVALKLANFRAIERQIAVESSGPGGRPDELPRGMRRYSQLDRAVFEEFMSDWALLPETATAIRTATGRSGIASRERPPVRTVPVERAGVESFEAPAVAPGRRTRREAALVERFTRWMAARGLHVEGKRFAVTGEARELVCDAYLPDLHVLVEAKAHDRRNDVRLAIGQLMDYRRFLGDPKLAVLLPHEPARDHKELLRSVGVGWLWEDASGGFRDSERGAWTRQPR